jgi:hypothetical protein
VTLPPLVFLVWGKRSNLFGLFINDEEKVLLHRHKVEITMAYAEYMSAVSNTQNLVRENHSEQA